MGIIYEQHNIQNVLDTANIIDEIKDTDKKLIKKVYNMKLIDKLERQETGWEVHADYRNTKLDPSQLQRAKMEKGQYKRFMKNKANRNEIK